MSSAGRPRTEKSDVVADSEYEQSFSPLGDAKVPGVQELGLSKLVTGGTSPRIKFIEKILVAGPKHSWYVLHQKSLWPQDFDKLEVFENQLVAWIVDTGILKPVSGKALARWSSEDDIAACVSGKVSSLKVIGIEGADIGLVERRHLVDDQVVSVGSAGMSVEFHRRYHVHRRISRSQRESACPRE